MTDELTSALSRLDWCARTLRATADRGREQLGDGYTEVLQALGAVKTAMELVAKANVTLSTTQPRPVTEEDIEAAREFLHDIDNGTEMRSALKQLRKEVIQELIDRGILATSYQMYLALFREGE